MHAESFAPVAGTAPCILVLGTMPGQTSLKTTEYYAHKRNAFWPIVLSVINNTAPDYASAHQVNYSERIQLLKKHHIALWDVLESCERPGSLDSAINRRSERANPLIDWIDQNRSVKRVCFNGKTAEALFKRHITPKLNQIPKQLEIEFATLPSTSPAMASLNLVQKTELWRPCLLP